VVDWCIFVKGTLPHLQCEGHSITLIILRVHIYQR